MWSFYGYMIEENQVFCLGYLHLPTGLMVFFGSVNLHEELGP